MQRVPWEAWGINSGIQQCCFWQSFVWWWQKDYCHYIFIITKKIKLLCYFFTGLFYIDMINSYSVLYFKACAHYFSLFLKDKCISLLVQMKYIEKKFNLQLVFLATVSWTFIVSWATMHYSPPWNFLFRKNNCMCNRDNACDVAACPSTKWSEPNKPSTNQDKHRERSSNICYTLNPSEHMPLNIKSNEIFF